MSGTSIIAQFSMPLTVAVGQYGNGDGQYLKNASVVHVGLDKQIF